jgi:aryl-alcohol dehydrogenase-like predicted oxidoreductase
MAPPVTDLRPESIRRECEASLSRLGVEVIDLYQIHWPGDIMGTPIEDSWGEMVRLQEDGKVRAIGVSNFTVAELERCELIRHVDSLQPPFSLLQRQAAADLFGWCADHETGVICAATMRSGLLTDRFSIERADRLAENDWRRRLPDFQSPQLERNLALRDLLVDIGRRRGVGTGAVAVAWTLAFPAVTGAIVGARTPEQVDGWLPAATIEFSQGEIAEIALGIEQTRAGAGPSSP